MASDAKRGKEAGVKMEKDVKFEADKNGKVTSGTATTNHGKSLKSGRSSSPPPPTTFRDIAVYSTLAEDWKYHLMKLASFNKVDPSDSKQFPWPVKLNRKWPPKLKDELPIQGDPVVDQWGKPVMIPPKRDVVQTNSLLNGMSTAESRRKTPLLWPGPDDDVHGVEELLARLETPKGPQADASLIGPSNTATQATRAKAGLFQKRVREVYKASSVARKTHNEEVLPWVLEDYETSKEWESRRKESRRGLKALQLGIKARREGGRFPSLSHPSLVSVVKKEEDQDEDDKKLAKGRNNHAPWIGKLEGEAHESASTSAGGAMSHALFIFDERGVGGFRVVPVSRMYKFLQRPAHVNNVSWEESEKLFERQQKAQFGEGMSKIMMRNGKDSREPVTRAARIKMEEDDHKYFSSLSQNRDLKLPGMGSDREDNKLASLYDRDSSARRNNLLAVGGSSMRGIRVKDEEGTYGEIDYEEDFADDEERNEGDDYAMNEDETKELEQRIKREMAKAEEDEKEGEDEDEDDDLFDNRGRSKSRRGEDDVLTGSGKQMKRIMKALARREGNDAYEDDEEDRNPYASDESSDGGHDTVMANPEEALRRVREDREREAKEAAKNGIKTEDASVNVSRAATPAIKTESGGISTPSSASRPGTATQQQSSQQQPKKRGAGHATAAQRAASPIQRANSQSRQGSRSGSPVEGTNSLKRKSEIGNNLNGKRPKTTQQSSRPSSPGESNSARSASPSRPGGRVPPSELEMEIIRLVQMGKAASAKELISHFNVRLKSNPAMRESFAKAVTRVLNSTPSIDLNGVTQKILSVKPGLID